MKFRIPSELGQRPQAIGSGILRWFILASTPALILGLWNVGLNIAAVPGALDSTRDWAFSLLRLLGIEHGASSFFGSIMLGSVLFVPRLATATVVSLAWAGLFAKTRRQSLDPGWFFHAWMFTLLLPASVPFPLLIIGLSFGLVFGCHVFGGTGRYIVNPALLAVVFLLVSYPQVMTNEWLPATGLPVSAVTSAGLCLAGALLLSMGGLASWRILVGGLAGMFVCAAAFASIPWFWQPMLGLFLFALAFVATDPSTMPVTRIGCWMLGILFGSGTVVIRMLNPEHPEGTLFALLLAVLVTPLIDHWAGARGVVVADGENERS
jgi:Na+-transporting NADH:ubiquinone oxidoreductase subunit B